MPPLDELEYRLARQRAREAYREEERRVLERSRAENPPIPVTPEQLKTLRDAGVPMNLSTRHQIDIEQRRREIRAEAERRAAAARRQRMIDEEDARRRRRDSDDNTTLLAAVIALSSDRADAGCRAPDEVKGGGGSFGGGGASGSWDSGSSSSDSGSSSSSDSGSSSSD